MDEQTHPELIIIRRRGGHEEEHHGGAWKIAFADFMTAMMAFFLVLWIIAATDKDTKTMVAKYFNPVRLEESSRTPKSIHGDGSSAPSIDAPGAKPSTKSAQPGDAATGLPPQGKANQLETSNGLDKPDPQLAGAMADMGDPASPKATMSEGVLFADPYRSLDAIAGPASPNALAIIQRDKPNGAPPEADGLADPFRPAARRLAKESTPSETPTAPTATAPAEEAAPTEAPPPAAAPAVAAAPESDQAKPQSAAAPVEAKLSPAGAARLQKELELEVGTLGGKRPGPAVDVKATDEGLLISLTDKLNFSMFAIGSAEPQPQVIQAMDAIARILKERAGAVVVRGHTDAHPYKSASYDNWRLSSARAQMAYYMLTRAGLPESRFERIEGYADKRLRDPSHPFAAENRRIEILLKEDKP